MSKKLRTSATLAVFKKPIIPLDEIETTFRCHKCYAKLGTYSGAPFIIFDPKNNISTVELIFLCGNCARKKGKKNLLMFNTSPLRFKN